MNQSEFIEHINQIVDQERTKILEKATLQLRKLLKNIPVTVKFGDRSLYGDFSGTPYKHVTPFAPFSYPPNIIIYASAFEYLLADEKKLRNKIHIVLIHEYGHYLGLSEGELRKKGVY